MGTATATSMQVGSTYTITIKAVDQYFNTSTQANIALTYSGLNSGVDGAPTFTPASGATATFAAGVYVIKDGQFKIGSSATATGSDVLFYLTGSNSVVQTVQTLLQGCGVPAVASGAA